MNVLDVLNTYSAYLILALLALLLLLFVIVIVLLVKWNHLKRAYESFMQGRDGASLENILLNVVEDNKKVKRECRKSIETIAEMKKGLKATYKKIGLMKYDTFRGMAGKLSFSLALLDGDDSGFVLSSMHTQDGCYTYLKEIIHGESHAVLSNEERDALNMALNYNFDVYSEGEELEEDDLSAQMETDQDGQEENEGYGSLFERESASAVKRRDYEDEYADEEYEEYEEVDYEDENYGDEEYEEYEDYGEED